MGTGEIDGASAWRGRRRQIALIVLGGALVAGLRRFGRTRRDRPRTKQAEGVEPAGKGSQGYIPALSYAWLTLLYDPVLNWLMHEDTFKRHLVQQARIERGHRVLDLGCGTATLTVMIKQSHPEAEVVGLDGDPGVLEVARGKAAKAGVDVMLDQGLAFELLYPDASFDRVLSSLLFHHLTREDKKRTLREVFRVLRPGGELHLADLGKPQNGLMRVIGLVMARLEETSDGIAGRLPEMMREASFEAVEEGGGYASIFGTVAVYRARKPEGSDGLASKGQADSILRAAAYQHRPCAGGAGEGEGVSCVVSPEVRSLLRTLLTLAMVLFMVYLVLDVALQATRLLGLWKMPDEREMTSHYGQWPTVVGSVAILSFFTLAYVVPFGRRNWRSAGLVQGFIIALFTEMYGFPLTIYVLASLIGLPLGNPTAMEVDGHLVGQAMSAAFGIDLVAAASVVMALSSTTMLVGFLLILVGWRRIYRGQGQLVTDGVYRFVRHPQYSGILLVTLALLVHWPTIVTIIMWPILVYTYYRLALREERLAEEAFGGDYRVYRDNTPMFLPHWKAARIPADP